MKRSTVVCMGLLTIGTLTGGALAAGPSKADMDFCNQKAAEGAAPSPAKPSTHNQPAKPPSTTGMQTDTSTRGTAVSPGAPVQRAPVTPEPGNNPSGGRTTDSSQPGIPPSQLGMSPYGETDLAYRQAYLACINERQN